MGNSILEIPMSGKVIGLVDEEIRKQILAVLKDCQYDFDYGYGETGPLHVRIVDRNKASYELLNLFNSLLASHGKKPSTTIIILKEPQ